MIYICANVSYYYCFILKLKEIIEIFPLFPKNFIFFSITDFTEKCKLYHKAYVYGLFMRKFCLKLRISKFRLINSNYQIPITHFQIPIFTIQFPICQLYVLFCISCLLEFDNWNLEFMYWNGIWLLELVIWNLNLRNYPLTFLNIPLLIKIFLTISIPIICNKPRLTIKIQSFKVNGVSLKILMKKG